MTVVIDGGGTGGCKITPKTQTTFIDGVLKSKNGFVTLAVSGVDFADANLKGYVDALEVEIDELEGIIENLLPGSSTDNAIVRWDGTDGKKIQNSGVIVSDSNEISGYTANLKTIADATYTLLAGDTGKILYFTAGAGCEITAPSSLGSAGSWCVTLVSGTTGDVSVAAGAGATVHTRGAKLAGQYAAAALFTVAAAEYVLAGNLA